MSAVADTAHVRASVLESHSSGASVIIGDESGHLTAFGWETEGHGSMGQQGSVRLSKVDLGIVSLEHVPS